MVVDEIKTNQHSKECIILLQWPDKFHQQPINVEKMGQTIQIPIKKRFFVSCYFLQVILRVTCAGLVYYGFVTFRKKYSHLILEHVIITINLVLMSYTLSSY